MTVFGPKYAAQWYVAGLAPLSRRLCMRPYLCTNLVLCTNLNCFVRVLRSIHIKCFKKKRFLTFFIHFFLSQAYSRHLVHNFIWILEGNAWCIRTIAMIWLWAFQSQCIIIISLSSIYCLFVFLFVFFCKFVFCFFFVERAVTDETQLLFRHFT